MDIDDKKYGSPKEITIEGDKAYTSIEENSLDGAKLQIGTHAQGDIFYYDNWIFR